MSLSENTLSHSTGNSEYIYYMYEKIHICMQICNRPMHGYTLSGMCFKCEYTATTEGE